MSVVNPEWIAYNNLNNEGGEGYNPHAQYVDGGGEPLSSILDDKQYRLKRIKNGTTDGSERYEQLVKEIAELDAAIEIAEKQEA